MVIVDSLLLVVGLALLIAGGQALVTGASRLAESLGVSEVAIGMTVVAFGTSAPELAVNWLAAADANASIAFGNVVGSNLANLALVVGAAALIRPLVIESVIVTREIPMMIVATVATLVLGLDRLRGSVERFDRSDGLILLLFFAVFLYYTIAEVLNERQQDPLVGSAVDVAPTGIPTATWKSAGLAVLGLLGLLAGAELTVENAVALATAFDVSDAVIGLTIVAVGTSLPELVTSLVAAHRGQTNLAVANIVGSNIFNLLWILGSTCVIHPIDVPPMGGTADLAMLAGLSLLLLPWSRTNGGRIVRWEGAVLLLAYFGYMAWRSAG